MTTAAVAFSAVREDRPGERWAALFRRFWPAYRRWYLQESLLDRPTWLECRRAVYRHMPELLPVWEALAELAGGGDVAARFLSGWCPPPYLTGCSQAVWPGPEPLLVRNYDYSPRAFEGIVLRTAWLGRAVMGTSDCCWGLVDGLNEAGIAVSLTFGGRRTVGTGFGMPFILRYVLETCATLGEATAALVRVPSHMAYNVTVLDRNGEFRTVMVAPDREPLVTRQAVATNHQERVEWLRHARATATVERERFLLQRLTLHPEPADEFVAAFLRPPLYSVAFDRGFGTLYTAAFRPDRGEASWLWPGMRLDLALGDFEERTLLLHYPD